MAALQVVVDAVDPRCLVCQPVSHYIDFGTITEQELHDITLTLHFPAGKGMNLLSWRAFGCQACTEQVIEPRQFVGSAGNIHGLACWFDVNFQGSADTRQLSTAPGSPVTHWYDQSHHLQCSNS